MLSAHIPTILLLLFWIFLLFLLTKPKPTLLKQVLNKSGPLFLALGLRFFPVVCCALLVFYVTFDRHCSTGHPLSIQFDIKASFQRENCWTVRMRSKPSNQKNFVERKNLFNLKGDLSYFVYHKYWSRFIFANINF